MQIKSIMNEVKSIINEIHKNAIINHFESNSTLDFNKYLHR